MTNAYKTATVRKKPSAPMVRLAADGRLVGRMLDYGCGRGCDADTYGMDRYDPHYYPDVPDGQFDTITCNYVLNVIEVESTRLHILWDIQARLAQGGRAYITVRTDKAALKGTTRTGSWQGHIVLDLPVVSRGSGYVTYELPQLWRIDESIQAMRTYLS
jgi:hypothetical protein